MEVLIIRTEIGQNRDVTNINLLWSNSDSAEIDNDNFYSTSCPNCDKSIMINVIVDSNLNELKQSLDEEYSIEKDEETDLVGQGSDDEEYETIKEDPETFDDIIEEYREDEQNDEDTASGKSWSLKEKMTKIVEKDEPLFECKICSTVSSFCLF